MSRERPSHRCFVVKDRPEGKDAIWTPIGSAWPHKDGKGFNLQLAALPATGGRIVLRELTKEESAEKEDSESTAAESRLSNLARTTSAAPGGSELQPADHVQRTGVREISPATKSKRRTLSRATSDS
jgi:hypothetical protein